MAIWEAWMRFEYLLGRTMLLDIEETKLRHCLREFAGEQFRFGRRMAHSFLRRSCQKVNDKTGASALGGMMSRTPASSRFQGHGRQIGCP